MAKYRLQSIAQLARQLNFAPQDVRAAQLDRAEDLLHSLESTRPYPLDFIIYRITDYRPKDGGDEMLTGLALQHDLGMLIEQVSNTLDIHVGRLDQPVLAIEDVCERFNVTSKTIQRWRRKGLPARRFIFPDGKRRVGFLLCSVERFLARTQPRSQAARPTSQVNDTELDSIVLWAKHLAGQCHCSVDEITRRIARRTGRSPLAVLHLLKKHDQEHAQAAVLPLAAPPLSEAQCAGVVKLHQEGASIRQIVAETQLPRPTVYRAILDERLGRLTRRRAQFIDDPLFHQDDAEAVIDALLAQQELADIPAREDLRTPRDLPDFLRELYRTPLLSKGRERALFLKLNCLKHQYTQARRRLEPELVRGRDLRGIEVLLTRIADARNAILQANLRLVVSVARRHLRPGVMLNELISDGSMTLMRAIDGFDISRGHRFSTYATLALMKGFARSVPAMLAANRRCEGDPQTLEAIADAHQPSAVGRLAQSEQVTQLLGRLSDRERIIVAAHFGLDDADNPSSYDQVGERLGLSRERVRQIEQLALAKLRSALQPEI